jgi:adenylate kinase family enzyme/YHS domain-containing protein
VACSFLGRIFFFETEKHRQAFADDPLTYVFQLRPPVFPFPPKISVLGNSELAARIASTMSTELIRPRDVIARVAKHQTTFGANVRKILATGKAVDAAIFRTALKAVLARHDCQMRGYVLDGYPTRLTELLGLREDGFMPSDLVTTSKADAQMVAHAIENFHNVIEIKDEPTVWMMNINATNALRYNMQQRWESLLAMDEKRAYCIAALDVSPEEVAANLSVYGHYCPITYVSDAITVSTHEKNWENIVKFNGRFYHPSTVDYRTAFLTSPIPFVYKWADHHQIRFATAESPDSLQPEHEGYDVIELAEGKFIKGARKLGAVFEGKLFLFLTEEHRTEFCQNTERYLKVPLPAHRPVDTPATLSSVSVMPPVAFLEQSVGDVITECIVELTKRRPKIPGTPMIQSMNQYIAAYIRANSKSVGELLHAKLVQQMEEMNERVSLAATLRESLETPFEMRDEVEHERLCKLWNETRHHT